MDLIDSEPRKHPSPVPFCQSIIKPSVPEVSLIFPDNSYNRLEKKNDCFSETEFQSYNAWKWKYMKPNDDFQHSEREPYEKCTGINKCCLIKDKYSSYDVEKRKNEILYGDVDEPRRPLPPRVVPVINTSSDVLSSFSSFDNFCSFDNDISDANKLNCMSSNSGTKLLKPNSKLLNYDLNSECDNSKLYTIITEQNNQITVLQKQIEQLLSIQEVKDKQIEQLLKTQESKEKKINQLLECLENKEKEIEKLLKNKEKQESHIQELLRVQEKQEKENMQYLKSLSELQVKKTVKSEGTMTSIEMIDFGVNTDSQCFINDKNDVSNCLRNSSDISGINGRDKSLSLHSADLPIINEHLPSPQSSIHVDIQDFHDSSEESDSDSVTLSNNCPTPAIQFTPIGYTFYNNVLTQVKDIIQNSGEKENKILDDLGNSNFEKSNNIKIGHNFNKENKKPLQRPIFEEDKVFSFQKDESNNNFVPQHIYGSSNFSKKEQSPSDVSFKINALAMKYLKKEQILQYNLEHQFSTPYQPDVTIFNVTNLSVGSMKYLERHKFLPSAKGNFQEKVFLTNESAPVKIIERKKKCLVEENSNTPLGNVLDISSLNQQPKLV